MFIQRYGDGARNDFPGDSGLWCGCKCHNIVMLLRGAIDDTIFIGHHTRIVHQHWVFRKYFQVMKITSHSWAWNKLKKITWRTQSMCLYFYFPRPQLWENFSNAALRSWSEAAESLLWKSPGYHCLPVYLFSNLKVAVGRFILIVLYVWLMLNCGWA